MSCHWCWSNSPEKYGHGVGRYYGKLCLAADMDSLQFPYCSKVTVLIWIYRVTGFHI